MTKCTLAVLLLSAAGCYGAGAGPSDSTVPLCELALARPSSFLAWDQEGIQCTLPPRSQGVLDVFVRMDAGPTVRLLADSTVPQGEWVFMPAAGTSVMWDDRKGRVCGAGDWIGWFSHTRSEGRWSFGFNLVCRRGPTVLEGSAHGVFSDPAFPPPPVQ